MTYDELRAVAQRRGYVRWDKSGVVEKLRLTSKGVLVARKREEKSEHVIYPHSAITTFYCVEVPVWNPVKETCCDHHQ